ncbi:MAG TPA: hypothetical protein VF661_12375, partial [Actinomycetales bacterium]
FSPPPGAKVTERTVTAPTEDQRSKKPARPTDAGGQRPTVIGSGWTAVLVMRGVDLGRDTPSPELNTLLRSAESVSGDFGRGRVLRTALATALILDDGRVLVGAVSPEVLTQAAATPAAR